MQGSEDRALGAFWGLAVGDAMGAPVEFLTPGTFPKVTGYQPSPRFGLEPGAWTDDTIMAVCMAESIIAEGGYDSFAVMQDYVDWMVRGHNSPNGTCFDIGIQTAKALRQFRANPAIAESTQSAGFAWFWLQSRRNATSKSVDFLLNLLLKRSTRLMTRPRTTQGSLSRRWAPQFGRSGAPTSLRTQCLRP